jgi:tetratricopeptide (TPR) repeat protein
MRLWPGRWEDEKKNKTRKPILTALPSSRLFFKPSYMKKSRISLVSLALFVLAAGFVVIKYNRDEKNKAAYFYPLKERKAALMQGEEWKQVQQNFADLMKVVGTNPDDIGARIKLAGVYIQEARVTGDYVYYDKAAMKYVEEVLEKDSLHFEALAFKSLLYLSQHHFTEGLAIAEKAKNINPHNAFIYGILTDGAIETGNYKMAIEHADKMISIRPDIRSYSRISYLREIHGDHDGAIEAMKLAVDAGLPGDEATEWARVQLAHLYEKTGDRMNAAMQYAISLDNRPGYAYAIAGQARMAMEQNKLSEAISLYMQADSIVNDYSIKEELADAYRLAGEKQKADSLVQWLINAMTADAKKGEKEDAGHNHNTDRELAHLYSKTGDTDKALKYALAEYDRRPENIDANETVAWVYYKKGDIEKALSHIATAFKTNSKDPVLLCHAGLIYNKAGDRVKSKAMLEQALQHDPVMTHELKAEAVKIIERW